MYLKQTEMQIKKVSRHMNIKVSEYACNLEDSYYFSRKYSYRCGHRYQHKNDRNKDMLIDGRLDIFGTIILDKNMNVNSMLKLEINLDVSRN